jgi:hypothetical protein
MIWVRLLRAKASSLKQILKKAAPKGRLFLLPDRPERRWESAFWKKRRNLSSFMLATKEPYGINLYARNQ